MTVKRKPLSKKLRFEVFKRDGFTCSYCGKTPPRVTLEVDHLTPVAAGGDNDINNLITACFDCNRGKAAIHLDKLPATVKDNLEILKEQESQLKEYRKLLSSIKRRKTREINKVCSIFEDAFPGSSPTSKFKRNSVGMFLDKLMFNDVEFAMEKAVSFIDDDPEDALKYFCGVCWRTIKQDC